MLLDVLDISLPSQEAATLLTDEQLADLRELYGLVSDAMAALFDRHGGITDAPEWTPIRQLARKALLAFSDDR